MKKSFALLLILALMMGLGLQAYASEDELPAATNRDAISAIYALSEETAYLSASQWGAENGVLTNAESFAPGSDLNYGTLASMLYRYALYVAQDDVSVESSTIFTYGEEDEVSQDIADAMNWAIAMGILDDTVDPQDAVIDEDMQAAIDRYVSTQRAVSDDENVFLVAAKWGRGGQVNGVQSFAYDVDAQQLSYIGTFGDYISMACVAQDGDLLFTCVETSQNDLILSFRILQNGALEFLDSIHIDNFDIAELSLNTEECYLFSCNFGSCSVSMIRYDENGNLELTDTYVVPAEGSFVSGYSINERQAEAYTHGAHMMPDGQHLAVCSMGSDKIFIFELDFENGKLALEEDLTITIEPGEGPRHIIFSEDGKFAYVNTEMGNNMYVFAVGEDSSLTQVQQISTLDPEQENTERGWTSVCILSQDGKYLYVANRGQNNIAAYAVGDDGLLSSVGYYDCYGESPRGIEFGYGDEVILCSSNSSSTISIIARDAETGALGECLQVAENIPGSAGVVWGAYAK